MLQKRRVFDLSNTILNYLFMVFLLLCGIYLFSYWFELKLEFLKELVTVTNVASWTICLMAVILVVLALVLAIADRDFKILTLIWCIVRMAICILLSVLVDASMILTSGGITVSL